LSGGFGIKLAAKDAPSCLVDAVEIDFRLSEMLDEVPVAAITDLP
jgi:hypothetical protein